VAPEWRALSPAGLQVVGQVPRLAPSLGHRALLWDFWSALFLERLEVAPVG